MMKIWSLLFILTIVSSNLIVGEFIESVKNDNSTSISSESSSASTSSASSSSSNQWETGSKSSLRVSDFVQRNRMNIMKDVDNSTEQTEDQITQSTTQTPELDFSMATFNATFNVTTNPNETEFQLKSLDEILELAGLTKLDIIPSTDPTKILIKTRSCPKTTKKSKKSSKKSKKSSKKSKKSKKKSKKSKKKKKKSKKSCCCCC